MQFARNLKLLMDQNGLTNYQLAKILGCHQSNIAYWLSGGRTPRKQTQKKLAELFDVTVESLMNGNALITLGKVSLEPPLLHVGNIGPKEKPTGNADGQLPHAGRREILASEGVRILLDADAKVTDEQLEDIIDFIKFQQRKNGR